MTTMMSYKMMNAYDFVQVISIYFVFITFLACINTRTKSLLSVVAVKLLAFSSDDVIA